MRGWDRVAIGNSSEPVGMRRGEQCLEWGHSYIIITEGFDHCNATILTKSLVRMTPELTLQQKCWCYAWIDHSIYCKLGLITDYANTGCLDPLPPSLVYSSATSCQLTPGRSSSHHEWRSAAMAAQSTLWGRWCGTCSQLEPANKCCVNTHCVYTSKGFDSLSLRVPAYACLRLPACVNFMLC